MNKQVKTEYAYNIALKRVLELQEIVILKEALILQQEEEINKLTTLLQRYLEKEQEEVK